MTTLAALSPEGRAYLSEVLDRALDVVPEGVTVDVEELAEWALGVVYRRHVGEPTPEVWRRLRTLAALAARDVAIEVGVSRRWGRGSLRGGPRPPGRCRSFAGASQPTEDTREESAEDGAVERELSEPELKAVPSSFIL